ncbi:MAG TPA: mechanosensitive ion channel domain-containing protein [Candidimonas sp.]|nr:mechanosensitive ion channel domain-containing protein [Candidimonas sp.]
MFFCFLFLLLLLAMMTDVSAAEAELESAPALTQGGLLDQLFVVIGQRLDGVMRWVQLVINAVGELRGSGLWWRETMGSPQQRALAYGVLWRMTVVLGASFMVERITQYMLARPRRLLGIRADVAAQRVNGNETGVSNAASDTAPVPALRYLRLLRRFPYALGYCLLELLPLLGFIGVASVVSSALGGKTSPFYGATIPLIAAYVNARFALAAVHLMISPQQRSLRLLPVGDGMTVWLNRWIWWVIVIAAFGMAAADLFVQAGAHLDTHEVVTKSTALCVHVLLLIMVWRSSKTASAAIRGHGATRRDLFGLRGILADIWPYAASFFIAALWLFWAAGIENGFQRVLVFFVSSAAVIIVACLVSIFALGAVDKAFLHQDSAAQPHAAERDGRSIFHLLARRAVGIVIGVATLLVLLQVWGMDTRGWFAANTVGRRLASAAGTIAITMVLAIVAWEAMNMAVSRRINRWVDAGEAARAARIRTLVPMLRSVLLVAIAMVVLLTALSQLGVNVAPLLAGASIIGVALGFGSQKLVQDFITGIFLLMENAMQVGDFVTVAGLSGTVEYLSIRTVRLRAGDGSLHVVPFSSVSTVTNTNRGIGNASIRVSVVADSDVDAVFDAIRSVGSDMRSDQKYQDLMLGDVDIWGVDQVDGSMITIAGQIRTVDRGRWPVQREFNRRILQRFRDRSIQLVNPKETRVISTT